MVRMELGPGNVLDMASFVSTYQEIEHSEEFSRREKHVVAEESIPISLAQEPQNKGQ